MEGKRGRHTGVTYRRFADVNMKETTKNGIWIKNAQRHPILSKRGGISAGVPTMPSLEATTYRSAMKPPRGPPNPIPAYECNFSKYGPANVAWELRGQVRT